MRYNWLDNVACPAAYCDYRKPLTNQSCSQKHIRNVDNIYWCFNPMQTIALYTSTSELPAPPFVLEVAAGKCVMPAGAQR